MDRNPSVRQAAGSHVYSPDYVSRRSEQRRAAAVLAEYVEIITGDPGDDRRIGVLVAMYGKPLTAIGLSHAVLREARDLYVYARAVCISLAPQVRRSDLYSGGSPMHEGDPPP